MKSKLYTIIALVLVLTGCQTEDLEITSDVKVFSSFTASFSDIGFTRTHFENSNRLVWDDWDEIGIYSDTQDVERFTFEDGELVGNPVKGKEFYAFSPYDPSLNNVVDKDNRNIIHVNLCSTADDTDYLHSLPLVAQGTDNQLRFKLATGLMRFSLKGTKQITYIQLRANNGELITGDGIIDISSDNPVLQMVPDEEGYMRTSIGIEFHAMLNEEIPTDIYFIVPVGVYEKGITLVIYGLDKQTGEGFSLKKKTDNPVEVKRAVIKSFSVLDTDAILEEETEAIAKERAALMDLYNSTDGQNWTHNDNWGSDKPIEGWYGVHCDFGHIYNLSLVDNNLNGPIPESFGNLTYLNYLNLMDNNISGSIPDTFGNLVNLKTIEMNNNSLTGSIPSSFGNLEELDYLNLSGNKLSGEIPKEVTDRLHPSYIGWDQQPGYRLIYASEPGEVTLLQQHTKGNGILLVITGEAFTQGLIADGTFRQSTRDAMEAFFSKEPYTSFWDYFDVYEVKAVSNTTMIGGDVVFETKRNTGTGLNSFNINTGIVSDYVRKVSAGLANITTIVILNNSGGVGRVHCEWSSDGFAIGLTMADSKSNWYEINHEAGGHGFAKLADEYTSVDPTGNSIYSGSLEYDHSLGWYMNVDTESDPSKVLWKDFIQNHDYDVEKIGVYEGALSRYSKGIYRATENSIMRGSSSSLIFNAPSRWVIYKHIMDLAGESYTFQDFLAYDKKNLERIANEAQTRTYVEKSAAIVDVSQLGAPPIIYDYPSSEIGMHK